MGQSTFVLTLAGLTALLGCGLAEAAKTPPLAPAPSAPPPSAAPPTPPGAPTVLPNPPQPVTDALRHGAACAPLLGQMSREALTIPYEAQSAWNQADPANHVFQSVAGLSHETGPSGDALVALMSAPVKGGTCDGVAVQVFPLALGCAAVEQILLKGGKRVGILRNTRIMNDADGKRIFLVPGFKDTCVAVSMNAFFETKPAK